MLRGELKLKRNGGTERYSLSCAQYAVYRTDYAYCFHLEFRCDSLLEADTPDFSDRVHPCGFIDVYQKARQERFAEGLRLSVPSAYDDDLDDWVLNLYYYDHHSTDHNLIQVLSVQNTRRLFLFTRNVACRIRWTGKIADPIVYDGSVPEAQFEVQSVFRRVDRSELTMS